MRLPLRLTLLASGLLASCGGEEAPSDSSRVALDLRASLHESSTQSRSVVDALSDGRLVVAWDSRRQEAGTYGVYARLVDPQGVALSDEQAVNQTARGMQQRPAVAVDARDQVWFLWESHGQDGQGSGLVARRFLAADGGLQPQSAEIPVNLTRAGDQEQAALAAGPEGGVLAVFASSELTADGRATGRFTLHSRRLDRADAPEELVVATPGASDELPSLWASEQGYVLAWMRRGTDAESGVFWQRLDRDGRPEGLARQVGVAGAIEPSLAGAADGSFVLAWLEPADGGYAVHRQGFTAEGAPRGAAQQLAEPSAGWLSGAAVASAADGRHLVAFNRDQGGELGEDLVVHYFAADGTPLGQQGGTGASAGRQALTAAAGTRRAVWTASDLVALAWDGDAGLGDASAAHLSLLSAAALPQSESLQTASQTGAAAAFALADAGELAIPPIWDPNWVPQERLLFPNAASGDFGFEAVPGTGWTPPDPEMAVGTNRIGVMTNGRIAIFDKAGVERWRDEIESSFGFWGSLGATGFVFDPEICWDPHDQRFLAMACERSSNSRSYFLLAVSKDATPDDANDWHKYRIDVTAIAGNDIDSPNMAVNQSYVLLTADFFGPDKYLLHIIDKTSIYSGGVPVSTQELISGTSQQSMGIPVVFDNTDTLYVVQSTEQSSNNQVIFHAITDPFTSYNRTTQSVTVQQYSYPNQPPQKGSSSRPFLFEPRFWSVAQRNGSIWAVHHVNSSRARVRWYEFEMNGWPTGIGTPSVRQWSEVDLGGQVHTFFPSIHVDGQNNAAISFARSSPNEYISMGRVTRAASDPLGTTRPAQVVQTSQNAHTSGRWGDYSSTQADPTADGVFWGHHEFTNGSTGSWRTWVARYDLRPAGLELAEVPIISGQSNTLQVSGATPGARVFFVYGTSGVALTEVAALSATLSVEAPQLIAASFADATGNASISRTLPPGAAGLQIWLQAAELGETSNWYSTVIQ